jgi:hypothetical protein
VFIEELDWRSRNRHPINLQVSLTHMANIIEIIKVPMTIPPRLKLKIVKFRFVNWAQT